jgi:hypothetical protein
MYGFFSRFSKNVLIVVFDTIGHADVSCPHQLHSSTTKVRSVWYKKCRLEIWTKRETGNGKETRDAKTTWRPAMTGMDARMPTRCAHDDDQAPVTTERAGMTDAGDEAPVTTGIPTTTWRLR